MPTLTEAHHIAGILTVCFAIFGYLIKLYVGNVTAKIKEERNGEINAARKSIEDKYEKEIAQMNLTLEKECNTEAIKNKVRDLIESQVKYMEQDVRQIKEITYDLKGLLGTQQETLIAIQMSVTELKPKIDNLEARVTKLESRDQ